ncbi:MAG: saccharopine dehydrogenase NADP-binding domain-containing protein [Burkholderiaceae bacterium]|jgi:short subunit dehydrogenase-like uncharacterized protein
MSKPFDLILFGASGFTGRLVAQYLHTLRNSEPGLRWAMAARNLSKLRAVCTELGIDDDVALIEADAANPQAMAALVKQTRLVITTVGPYQQYGEALIGTCAANGTDYVDLCGEPTWMARMIPQLQGPARASGARIVFSCGFDSIPFDLGVLFLQDEIRQRFSTPATQVHGRMRVMKGGISGGTIASALTTVELIARDPSQATVMNNPFALTPALHGPAQPDGELAAYDPLAKSWTGPFMMAAINTKNIHRTHALLGQPWGPDFRYDERMLCGDGEPGRKRAQKLQRQAERQALLLRFAPSRWLLRRFVLAKPGQGPSLEKRESGRFEVLFIGQTASRQMLKVCVSGDRDPGYASTAKMLAQSALCLLQDVDHARTAGGVWTPGAAMGQTLIARLQRYAGLRFTVED